MFYCIIIRRNALFMVLRGYHPKYEVQNKMAFEFQEITKKNHFLLDTDKENEDAFIYFLFNHII